LIDAIAVAMFLSRMQLPLDQLQAAMNDAQQTAYEEAVKRYIKKHPKRVNYWITGQFE
jgi:glycine betaine/proline transport system substrate-binding protein